MTSCAVVIVNWNKFLDTRGCLQSLLAAQREKFTIEIIVVDNGSTDDSVLRLRQEFGEVISILESSTNLGFAGGNNVGIRRALEMNAELIILLNNDTIVAPDFFQKVAAAADEHPGAGIFGGKIFYQSPPQRLWFAGGEVQKMLAKARHFGFGSEDAAIYQKRRRVSFITGCLMIVRRTVFERIGLLQDDLFLYFEDTEFCLRACRQGIEMIYLPDVVIWHEVGAGAIGAYAPHYYYYQTRNRYVVMKQEGGWWYRLWLTFLHIFLYSGARTVMLMISSQPGKWRRVHALWLGCWDGLLGRTGERRLSG